MERLPVERDLEIVIRGGIKSGKSTVALAIRRQLKKLGAKVRIEDEPLTTEAIALRKKLIKKNRPILDGKIVLVRTQHR